MKSSSINKNLNDLTESVTATQVNPSIDNEQSIDSGNLNTNNINTEQPIQVAGPITKSVKHFLKKKLEAKKAEVEGEQKLPQEEIVVPSKQEQEKLDLVEEGQVGPYHVIGEADPKIGAEIINKTPTMPKEGRPKGGKKNGVKITKTPINVNMIESADDLKQHVLATAEVFGVKDVAGKISYDTITSKFNKTFSVQSGKTSKTKDQFAVYDDQTGEKVSDFFDNEQDAAKQKLQLINNRVYDEKFLADLLDKNKKTLADPEYAYKMMVALHDASDRAYKLAKEVEEFSRDKIDNFDVGGTPVFSSPFQATQYNELYSNFLQAIALEGNLMRAVKGRQADIARTLGIFSQKRVANQDRATMFANIMSEVGGAGEVYSMAKKYLALDSRDKRSKFSEVLGVTPLNRVKDILWSGFVNNLLSSPTTHAKNIVGNGLFAGIQPIEYLAAAGFGKFRKYIAPKTEESIRLNSVMRMINGYYEGFSIGRKFFVKTLRSDKPNDRFQKIEMERRQFDPYDTDLGDGPVAKFFENGFRAYGKVANLPGRFLMAEDEAFKAFNKTGLLYFRAAEEAASFYDELLNAKNVDELRMIIGDDDLLDSLKLEDGRISALDAQKLASEYEGDILTNPQDYMDIVKEVNEFARKNTFTNDLEGIPLMISNALNTKLLGFAPFRLFSVFVRTPLNITDQVLQRTPLALVNKTYRDAIKAGGKEADLANARLALGSSITMPIAFGTLDGKITGYGPFDWEDRNNLLKQGWRPFSFVFNRAGFSGNYEEESKMLNKYKNLLGEDSVSIAGDKIYISYAGIEPISALFAMGATFSEYTYSNPWSELSLGSTMQENATGFIDNIMKLGTAATLSISQYLRDQTYLTSVSDFIDMFAAKGNITDGDYIYNIFAGISEQTAKVAIGGFPVYGLSQNAFNRRIESIMTGGERTFVEKPVKKDPTGIYKGPMDAVFNSFFQVARNSYLKSPWRRISKPKGAIFLEEKQLDTITGKPIKWGNGSWSSLVNPFDFSVGQVSEARLIMQSLDIPDYRPSPYIQGESKDGISYSIRLNDYEMQELIKLATMDNDIEQEIIDTYERKNYYEEIAYYNLNKAESDFNLYDAQTTIKSKIDNIYKTAKKELRTDSIYSDEIQKRIEERVNYLRKEGKYSK